MMTKELIEKDIQINELQLKNEQLEQDLYIALNKIDKAIDYIKEHTKETNFDNDKLIDILEILGDKDGTSNN